MVFVGPVSRTPEEHLAWDEALLDWAEAGDGDEALWFWEATETFVVIGYSQSAAREVRLAECEARGIPVLRRCSGGGAVVQGPGCLNYGLVLRTSSPGPLATIASANASIMARQRRAFAPLLPGEIVVSGHTDLVLEGRKFSGNAQRRRQRHLLFHGTILLSFDLALMDALLAYPSRAPEYRAGRPHRDFVCNTGLKRDAVETALRMEWKASELAPTLPRERARELVAARYSQPEWNRRR